MSKLLAGIVKQHYMVDNQHNVLENENENKTNTENINELARRFSKVNEVVRLIIWIRKIQMKYHL
jgi:hypothetical protein